MAQFAADVYDYNSADKFLGDRDSKKLAHETYVERRYPKLPSGNKIIVVTLFGNMIAKFWDSGDSLYTNSDYGTHTTRDRLNQLSRDLFFTQRDFVQMVGLRTDKGYPQQDTLEEFLGVVSVDKVGQVIYNEKYLLNSFAHN